MDRGGQDNGRSAERREVGLIKKARLILNQCELTLVKLCTYHRRSQPKNELAALKDSVHFETL